MKKGQKEQIDISTLPEVNTYISSVIFNFQNNERRLKIIETFIKMPEKTMKLCSREEIIQYAKDQKIYVDPAEGKKPAKGEPAPEHKDITPEELAKATLGFIKDNSVQFRKEKKDLLDNIENLKKQKEDAIAYWANPPEQDPKKKPDKKGLPPKPEEIIIPEIGEYDVDYTVVLFNYPLNGDEYAAMEKEGLVLNNVNLITEGPDVVEEVKEEEVDPKKAAAAKKNAPKDAGKPVSDNAIIKNYSYPSDYNPNDIFDLLYDTKSKSDSLSKMRETLFQKTSFNFKNIDDPKNTYFNIYQQEFLQQIKEINQFHMMYNQWGDMHKFQELGSTEKYFGPEIIDKLSKLSNYKPNDYEHMSIGNMLAVYFGVYNQEDDFFQIPVIEEPIDFNVIEEEKRKKEEELKKKMEEEAAANAKNKKGGKDAKKQQEVVEEEKKEEEPKEEDELDEKGINNLDKIFNDENLLLDEEYNPVIEVEEEDNEKSESVEMMIGGGEMIEVSEKDEKEQNDEPKNFEDINYENIGTENEGEEDDEEKKEELKDNSHMIVEQNEESKSNINMNQSGNEQSQNMENSGNMENENNDEPENNLIDIDQQPHIEEEDENDDEHKEEEEKKNTDDNENEEENTLHEVKKEDNENYQVEEEEDEDKEHKENEENISMKTNTTSNIQYERLIINENDDFMRQSIETKSNQIYLYQIEKSFNNFRALPGLYRKPTLLPIELHLRKAIRSRVYPFLPDEITIPIYEKFNIIQKFEECMKEEFPDREFDFGDRSFQENLNKDILSQRITKLLMLDPEIKTYYNENTDNMLLMMYYRIPKERVYRKLIKYRYLSKPDFENWVKYFKPVFTPKKPKEQEENKEENQEGENKEKKDDKAVTAAKNNTDNKDKKEDNKSVTQPIQGKGNDVGSNEINSEEAVNKKGVNPLIKTFAPLDNIFCEPMYLSSDAYLGQIKAKIKYMFPADNGVFIKKVLENGIFSSFSSYVLKDDMVFGIRKDQEKNKEFWYHYDNNGTSLSISQSDNKLYTNFSLANGLNVQILPSGEIAQKIYNEPSFRINTSKASIIIYNEDGSKSVLYANGNVAKIVDNKMINTNNKGNKIEKNLETGEIKLIQKVPVTVQSDLDSQTKTMLREDGVINIKYPDESSLTIHTDQTKIYTSPYDNYENINFIVEHDKYCTVKVYVSGKSRIYPNSAKKIESFAKKSKDGIIYQVLLADKNEIILYKEQNDKNVTIIFNNDGGVFKVDSDKNDILILSPNERNKYHSFTDFENVIYGEIKDRKGGLYTVDLNEGKIFTIDDEENLFEIYDDGYANCELHPKTFLEMDGEELVKYQEELVKILLEEIGGGEEKKEEVVEEENKEEEKKDDKKKDDKKKDDKKKEEEKQEEEEKKEEEVIEEDESKKKKLKRTLSPDYELLNLQKEEKKKVPIENQEEQKENISKTTPNLKAAQEKEKGKALTMGAKKGKKKNEPEPQIIEEEEIEEEKPIPPPTSNFYTPKLFVIENDMSGYELLNYSQFENYKKCKMLDYIHCKYIIEKITDDFTSHYWITKYFNVAEGIKETHHINQIQIPESLTNFYKQPYESEFDNKEIYFYRNLIQSDTNFDKEFREKVKKSKEESDAYFEQRNMEFNYGSYYNKEESSENIEQHNKLLRRILTERQVPDVKFDYDKIRKKIKINQGFISLLDNESVLFNIKDFVDDKEKKKYKEDKSFRIYPLNLNKVSDIEVENIVNNFNAPFSGAESMSASIVARKKNLIEGAANQKEIKFIPNYWDSEKGKEFLSEHPHEVYIDPKEKNKNNSITGDPEIDALRQAESLLERGREELNQSQLMEQSPTNLAGFDNNIDMNNKQSSPVVLLNGDNQLNNQNNNNLNNMNEGTKSKLSNKRKLPSIHKQTQMMNKINEEYNEQKAREWVESKTMKYTVDGGLRQSNPLVPHYIKPTFPQADFNEDYIYIDKLTEKRVKTSSVSNRIYFNAPSVEEIRKSGQHDILLEAIEHRRTPEEMMERLNLMITGELCDPLNKQLKIDPVQLDFGVVCQGKNYQMYFKLRNDDNMTNRVMVRKSNSDSNFISIENFVGGKVVYGETKKVKVVLKTGNELLGKFNDLVEVTTKSFIYKIPIKAFIVKENEFDPSKYGNWRGRENYTKTYPAQDNKYKCDPIKIVLPKIKELEEKERQKKLREKGSNDSFGDNNNSDGEGDGNENNNDNDRLPPV